MVKREPNIIRGRLGIFVVLGYILFGFYYAFFMASSRSQNPWINFSIYIVFGAGVVLRVLSQERFWRLQDQRRQQAAQGNQNLVASFQPTPDAVAIPLPTTIVQRTVKDWTIYLIIAAIVLLGLFAFLIYELILQPTLSDLLLLLFMFWFITAAFAYYLVAPVVRGYQRLTVDDDGIHVRVGFGRVHSMCWQDARLFAATTNYRPVSDLKQFPPYYELSNANEVVRWHWIRTPRFVAIEPTLPIGEYDRQMKAVLSLVVAKTKLTLYDVRPAGEKWT